MKTLTIKSHKGPYQMHFVSDVGAVISKISGPTHFLIDRNVASKHGQKLSLALSSASVLLIDASEEAKSLEKIPNYVSHLLTHGVRRGQTLTAIGGGIIQDITCFLSATLLRGIDWNFVPTTLLAMADSAIGSKSSINCTGAKNILGTFTPPKQIWTDLSFLETLDEKDIRSGIGEMLKVHAIKSPAAFKKIASQYPKLLSSSTILGRYLRESLNIKKGIIENDEFDQGPRLVMNYGHSFGHAIEAATNFAIPHGIAVTIGMDLANFISARLKIGSDNHYRLMHPTLSDNWRGYDNTSIPTEKFFDALSKDKKNSQTQLGLILPDQKGRIARHLVNADEPFRSYCKRYLELGRRMVLS